jgi:hypothetical protein
MSVSKLPSHRASRCSDNSREMCDTRRTGNGRLGIAAVITEALNQAPLAAFGSVFPELRS